MPDSADAPASPSRRRVLRAAIAGLVPWPLREYAVDGPPTDDEVEQTKQEILARLDGPGRLAGYWQLADALDADHHTLRLALEGLQDEGRVLPAAVFWRPDRADGEGVPVAGPKGRGSDA